MLPQGILRRVIWGLSWRTPCFLLKRWRQSREREIEKFEASESIAKTGTGARREGSDFEGLVATLWSEFAKVLAARGASLSWLGDSERFWSRLAIGERALILPSRQSPQELNHVLPRSWLRLRFPVREIVARFPGEAEAILRYAPTDGPYGGESYPKMYQGLSTTFDGLILREESGVLREKTLLEYKTAKSSNGRTIDGNAHERLSFQIMQYLEVATAYTKCSLVVIANGAFARYINKYHVSFHTQADRLSNFAWFNMDFLCTVQEYARFITRLLTWVEGGNENR